MGFTLVSVDEAMTLPDCGRPFARHVACPVGTGVMCLETPNGKRPIPPPIQPNAIERAQIRQRLNALGPEAASTVEGVLDSLLVGLMEWERAVLATRSVGAFRLPPTGAVREGQLQLHRAGLG